MYIVKFENRTYTFPLLADAEGFAKTWGAKAEYRSICGKEDCHCETACKSFHYGHPQTTNNETLTTILGQEQDDYQINN